MSDTKPAIAMVLIFCETTDPDKGESKPIWLAKKADRGDSLTLWNAVVLMEEDPITAATRAMNQYFKGDYEPHMLMPMPEVLPGHSPLHLFFFSGKHMNVDQLRDGDMAECVSIDRIGDIIGQLTPNASVAISWLRMQELGASIISV